MLVWQHVRVNIQRDCRRRVAEQPFTSSFVLAHLVEIWVFQSLWTDFLLAKRIAADWAMSTSALCNSNFTFRLTNLHQIQIEKETHTVLNLCVKNAGNIREGREVGKGEVNVITINQLHEFSLQNVPGRVGKCGVRLERDVYNKIKSSIR